MNLQLKGQHQYLEVPLKRPKKITIVQVRIERKQK
ncbi:hypothetical protein M621_16105 [Serratia plymuthica S13]|uniref:Uncharacterized protein n=1 Tax=Serratia plymuthica S13 TaxID=1348660 RepID=S4YQV7_SERPL|nr:hypothetical protein M621_16105 [Serratia plymuthica S13]